jgi:hypothetical protein
MPCILLKYTEEKKKARSREGYAFENVPPLRDSNPYYFRESH